jgi:uncharacterized protein (TIGR02145 family)
VTTNGAWAYYFNDPSFACPYGKLYNWYTCVDSRGLCPIGWHVPSDEEWSVLIDYLGGSSVAGGKMKATDTYQESTALLFTPITDATNSSGFSGVPGGSRYSDGYYDLYKGYWWSSSESTDVQARLLILFDYENGAYRPQRLKQFGHSVRCVLD